MITTVTYYLMCWCVLNRKEVLLINVVDAKVVVKMKCIQKIQQQKRVDESRYCI